MAADQRTEPMERIDPRDAAFFARADLHEVLAQLRAEDPVHECEPGFWVVSRYNDIRDLSRDPAHFCSGRGALVNDPLRTAGQPALSRSILHMDPPEHAAFRKLVNRQFTRGPFRASRSPSARVRRRCWTRRSPVLRSTSSPSWRRRSR